MRELPSTVTDRHAMIIQWLADEGRLDVPSLAERLGVAQETVRRDLRALESGGRLQRVHGGAVPVETDPFPTPQPVLNGHRGDRILAENLWARLPRTGSILLGAGRLTSALVAVIAEDPPESSGLTVVSNSLDAAIAAARIPQLAVYNIGGAVSSLTRAQEGDWALQELERLQVDVSVVCPAGMSPERGLGQPTPAAAVSQAEVSCGAMVIAVAEATILGRPAFVQFASWREVDTLLLSGRPIRGALTPYLDRGVAVEVIEAAADDVASGTTTRIGAGA